MEQKLIFLPMFSVLLLTFVVWVYMYVKRIPFIQKGNFTPEQLTPLEFAKLSPPEISNPSDNLKNLFEIPVLFYVLCIYLYTVGEVDQTYLVAAWIFAGFRLMHSAVHCTVNIVLLRFWLYVASTMAFWFMLGRSFYFYI